MNPGTTLTIGRTTTPANDLLGPLALNGGTIDIGPANSAATATFGSNLSLAGGAMVFALSNSATSGNDAVDVVGNLNLSNTTSIFVNKLNPALNNGNYPLFSFSGSLTGTPSSEFTLAGNPLTSRQTASFATSGSTVYLDVVGGPQTLTWAGTTGSAWNNNTSNYVWTNSASNSDIFVLADNVIFNDSNTNTAVIVNDVVGPGTMTIAGSQSWRFSGSGSIVGPASSLTMNGSGLVTLATTGNSWGGGTLLSSGTLAQGAAFALSPSSALTMAAPATFDLGGFNALVGPLSGAGLITNSGTSGTNTFATNTTTTTTFSGAIQDGAQATVSLQLSGSARWSSPARTTGRGPR